VVLTSTFAPPVQDASLQLVNATSPKSPSMELADLEMDRPAVEAPSGLAAHPADGVAILLNSAERAVKLGTEVVIP
jgi:hypothetical protein